MMSESEYDYPDPEAYAQGWRKYFQEALDAALEMEDVPVGEVREVDVIYGRRRNPIHEYRVSLKPRE
jgi:hypothetical protein